MKKTSIISLLLAAATSMSAYAQEETPSFKRNTVYAELGGYLSQYSLNYDRVFNPEGYFKWSLSAGVGYNHRESGFSSARSRTYVVPLGIYGFTGKRNSHFEVGITLEPAIFNYQQDNSAQVVLNPIEDGTYFAGVLGTGIGYRYQRPTGGLFFAVRSTWFMQGYYPWRKDSAHRNVGDYYRAFSAFPNLKLAIGYTFK